MYVFTSPTRSPKNAHSNVLMVMVVVSAATEVSVQAEPVNRLRPRTPFELRQRFITSVGVTLPSHYEQLKVSIPSLLVSLPILSIICRFVVTCHWAGHVEISTNTQTATLLATFYFYSHPVVMLSEQTCPHNTTCLPTL
jgi:hypothetical protein